MRRCYSALAYFPTIKKKNIFSDCGPDFIFCELFISKCGTDPGTKILQHTLRRFRHINLQRQLNADKPANHVDPTLAV